MTILEVLKLVTKSLLKIKSQTTVKSIRCRIPGVPRCPNCKAFEGVTEMGYTWCV